MQTKVNLAYSRPNMDELTEAFSGLLKEFENANSLEAQNNTIRKINGLREKYDSMQSLVYLRCKQCLTDEVYQEEQDFFAKNDPIFDGFVAKFYQALIESPNRKQLELEWGQQIFKIAEAKAKTFSPLIEADLQLENELIGKYYKLLGTIEVDFDGETHNLFQMNRFTIVTDRDKRKAAYEAMNQAVTDQEDSISDVLDQLIKVRNKMAKQLGYPSFIEMGYDRLKRTNYKAKDVELYRNEVKKHGVPFVSILREKQRQRIGVEKLKYYDERVHFLDSEVKVNGTREDIINSARQMFNEMSSETNEFFTFMTENELLDLESRQGKSGGAFATYIPNEKAPFIFANFIGTSNDVRVLTHEAGHAFQFYMSRNTNLLDYIAPTFDAAEIFSFTMERFAWPWMDKFFGEDAEKYKFAHLTEAFILMPWANAIDEFQHYLYAYPEATTNERKAKWRELEKEYMPEKDYDGFEFLEEGGGFYQIGHLFHTPFYFIDYDLAHNCAIQLWIRYNENREKGWEDFLNICKIGGSENLVEIFKRANLKSPFEEGSIQSIIGYVEDWLEQFEEINF